MSVTVLGVGNTVMGDDGVGPALLERLVADGVDPRVTCVDGGTGGLALLPDVQDARRLLVLDAVRGPTPGAVVHLTGDQLPRLLGGALSPHQVGLLDLLSAARLLGTEPERVEVVGVVPGSVAPRVGLSPAVAAALPAAAGTARAVLRGWLSGGQA